MNIVRTIVLLVAAAVLLGGCVAGNRGGQDFREFAYGQETFLDLTAEKHVQIARGYLARGNSEQAYMHLTKAQEKAPEDMNIRALKGELLIDQRQDELALNEFLTVLEAAPDHAAANQGAGIIYFRAGLYKEAEAHLSLAVNHDDTLWKAHNYLGIIYDRQGDYDLAADAFTRALGHHQGKEAPAILNNLGMVHMARKDYGLAVQAFKRALQDGPPASRTYNNLGVALAHGGKYAEALEAFRFASNEYVACNNLGFVLLSSGDPEQAIPYFERALELAPSFYTKASENLKRARMASRFGAPAEIAGSTPNPLSPEPFPSEGQTVDGAAATVKTIAAPSSGVQPALLPKAELAETDLRQADRDSGQIILQDVFGIHASSWRDLDWAQRHCRELEAKGFKTWVNRVRVDDSGTWHRVLVGRYPSLDEAMEARPAVLDSLGMDHALIYRLQAVNMAAQ